MNELHPQELKAYIGKATTPPILIDVREQWEYDVVHLPNSQLVPLAQLPAHLNQLDEDAEIVLICHHGIRSRAAALYLEQQGFKKVINLKGGIDAWAKEVDADMPTYR